MTAVMAAPDAAWRFRYRGQTYRVTGWLKPLPSPEPATDFDGVLDELLYETQQRVGPRKERLVFCAQDEAVYVSGAGIAGCCAPLDDIEVLGPCNWSVERIDEAAEAARLMIGTRVW
jgi:hypothetical protein